MLSCQSRQSLISHLMSEAKEHMEPFEKMLTGGHPNSLGRTVEVVDIVLADPSQFEQLFQCYSSKDEVVRLRTSSAMKRLWRAQPSLIVPHIDRFLSEVSQIQQASTQWTLATLFEELDEFLTDEQRTRAINLLKSNLDKWNDWIVIINTMQALSMWATTDDELKVWLKPYLERFAKESRKSIARKAEKIAKSLYPA